MMSLRTDEPNTLSLQAMKKIGDHESMSISSAENPYSHQKTSMMHDADGPASQGL